MSLLFEHAVEQFSPARASLCAADESDLNTTDTDVPVRPIGEFARHHASLAHPERDWTCIPLHGRDDAEPTDEFVAYTDHDVRGEIFLVERDGDYEPIAAEEFGRTQVADRIRFWHSDYLPESYPPGYDAPIDDHERPRNPVDGDLLDEFRSYVAEERDATRDGNWESARRQSARTRYEQGESAIPSLTCLGEDDDTYRFRVELDSSQEDRRNGDWAYFVENEFGIYQDNEVLLHADDDADQFPIAATVQRIRGLTLWLTVDWSAVEDSAAVGSSLEQDRRFGLSELLNPVPFQRELDAIDDLWDDAFREVLVGDRPLTFSNEAAALSESFDAELNQEQQLAVEYALLADDLFCIHGPPGTGKTRTLLEIIRRAVDAGEDVLVCADSNQALDNLVVGSSTPDEPDAQSLHAHGQHGDGEFTLDRANAGRSAHELVRRQYGDVPDRADVVAATNSSAAALARDFDLVVLDEATQSTCTASCIPLARADRAVLAGDHRQLPPFSATEDPPASSYGLSLFEHLYADGGVYEGVGLQLKTQYRMHPDIAYFSNREFYDRTLRNGEIVTPLPDRPAIQGYNVGGSVDLVDHSRANTAEARLVVHLVSELLDEVPPAEIGVISPYAAHVRLVRERLDDHVDASDAITVDTIDSFQGSEKTAIVLSLVRSNAEGDLGFLGRPQDGPRRLNVALTRAKRYCAVVGDFHTLRYDSDGKSTELYQDFRDFFATTGRLNDVDPDFIPV
ncbi:DNA-binding protein (plasmid) [Halorientalis sp. IM1011]|uniref:AAA domain-containing protein n=1 Tax=Halorientalis sp. IM1011 TaxID=1932360 RepID=UPI00097CD3C7|nr:AAA domain-containing protein [Halorientalis sp. IM1011]AQL44740.1 DNA-binding protein [Halorientalis sp. IM1011]